MFEAILLAASGLAAGCSSGSTVEPAPPRRRHWVSFVERTAQHAGEGSLAVTKRAIERRGLRARGAVIDERDLHVDPSFVAALRALGANVRTESRWLHAVSIEAPPATLEVIASLPFVREIRPVRGGRRDELVAVPADATGDSAYGAALPQLSQIELLPLHARGFRGAGVVIGVLDTGFSRIHEAFQHPERPLEVIAEWDFINQDGDTAIEKGDDPNQHRHGTWILGTMAAYLPGELLGAAYDASYILAKTEDVTSETPIEEDFYVAGLEWIEALGADVATSSLGYIDWYLPEDLDGATAVTTIAVNIATAKGLICVTAAGNGGHDDDPATWRIIAPADAFDVISCGAVRDDGSIAGFSADGPTADGRVKPEVLARGVGTATVHSIDPSGLAGVSGTSLSTPLVAGAVACILEARPELDAIALRTLLFASATEAAAGPDPLFVRGYGIVQADSTARSGRAPGDLDLDGVVGGVDLAVLLGAWGTCGFCEACPADLDADCLVGASDLTIMLGSWGSL